MSPVVTQIRKERLQASGVEIMLRKMGIASDVGHVHPHKFRRTMATAAIDKGMPIEQVQRLLGHEKISFVELIPHPNLCARHA